MKIYITRWWKTIGIIACQAERDGDTWRTTDDWVRYLADGNDGTFRPEEVFCREKTAIKHVDGLRAGHVEALEKRLKKAGKQAKIIGVGSGAEMRPGYATEWHDCQHYSDCLTRAARANKAQVGCAKCSRFTADDRSITERLEAVGAGVIPSAMGFVAESDAGCPNNDTRAERFSYDGLEGRRFGMFTVLREEPSRKRHRRWLLVCDEGHRRTVPYDTISTWFRGICRPTCQACDAKARRDEAAERFAKAESVG
jgi:hypothetical protein